MQLSFDAADRLVELSRHDTVRCRPRLRRRRSTRCGTSRPVSRARCSRTWSTATPGSPGAGRASGSPSRRAPTLSLESATYVVVDLETTGLSPRSSAICEIGAVRVRGLELEERFETLVNPRRPLPAPIAALTGIDPGALRGAPPIELAMRRFLDFAGDAVLVAHNARFDMAFLDREVERLTGRRIAAPVVDTVWLARRLLAGRLQRVGLASLAYFFGTATRPCHRALADAEATAEILLALIGLAQETGATTVAQLVDLSAPRARRLAGKRHLVAGAPTTPGVYLFRDRHEQVLYVGRARDLRARLRSYFRTERQRPAVEAALGALERVEWRVLGSELEAGLEELRLLRELRPPANARSTRPDRYVYLRRRGAGWCVTDTPGPHGPLKSRRRAQAAARALGDWDGQPVDALPALRAKLKRLAGDLRFEDAARLRDRIEALDRRLHRARRARPPARAGALPARAGRRGRLPRAFFVSGGRVVAARTLPARAGGAHRARGRPRGRRTCRARRSARPTPTSCS